MQTGNSPSTKAICEKLFRAVRQGRTSTEIAQKTVRAFNATRFQYLLPSASRPTTARPAANSAPKASGFSPKRSFSTAAATPSESTSENAETVPIVFIDPDGTEQTVQAQIGQHLLDCAHANDVELEGACGGELACSTCHLIFEKSIYDQLPEKSEEEEDMLDLAFEVEDTSRLGCQIPVKKEYAGMKLRIPDDGFH